MGNKIKPESFLTAFRDYRVASLEFKPKIVYWNDKFFCSYSFSCDYITNRGMEVIHG